MKRTARIILIIVALYILTGIVHATKWSINYDPSQNLAPNNAKFFIFNTLVWPFGFDVSSSYGIRTH